MLAGDADGVDAAPFPMSVVGVVVGFAGGAVVRTAVDLDDRGAAVADDDEAGRPHA